MPNTERRTPNAECRMHCLLAVSFTCVCLRLAFIFWKGPNTIKCCPFQQIKANRKQTQVKLTASKQCIRHSAFGIRHSAFGIRHSAFGVLRPAFGVRRSAFSVQRFTPAGMDIFLNYTLPPNKHQVYFLLPCEQSPSI